MSVPPVRLSCKPRLDSEGFSAYLACISPITLWVCLLLEVRPPATINSLFQSKKETGQHHDSFREKYL